MSRTCTVCAHPEAIAINEALVLEKASNRTIAKQYDLHHSAVQRHREHIPKLLFQAYEADELASASELLAEIRRLYAEAQAVLEAGKADGDHRLVLAAIETASRRLETLLEVAGELNRASTTNINLSAEWVALRGLIISALRPHPEARASVLAAIQQRELTNGSA